MNKGVFDIIRSQWLFDSIANKELVPMSKKYFFHATAERMESEEYNDEDDDLGLEGHPPEETMPRLSASPSTHADGDASESKEEDSEMQEWLQIGPSSNAAGNASDDAESVTDPDSADEDNWFGVEAPQPGGAEGEGMEVILCTRLWGIGYSLSKSSSTPAPTSTSKLIWRRRVRLKWVKTQPWNTTRRRFSGTCMFRLMTRDTLYDMLDSYFYLDTPHNARNNGMSATSKHEVAITKRFVGHTLPKRHLLRTSLSFERIAKLIGENGGRAADLEDAKLTHVVLDKRDDSRRRELMKRTSKYGHMYNSSLLFCGPHTDIQAKAQKFSSL